MVLAAEFRALTEVDAFLGRLEPQLGQTTRNAVLLHAEGGDGPGVNHVRRSHLHHDGLADRHDNGRIGGQQIFVFVVAVVGQFFLGQQEAFKAELVIDILITPVPLVAGHLDGDVAFGDLLLAEQFRQREGADEDEDQNRDHGPGDFNRSVVGERRRLGVPALVETHDRVKQQTRHEYTDHRDDHQDQVIEHMDTFRQFGRGRLEAKAAVDRLTNGFQTFLRCGWKAREASKKARKHQSILHVMS